MKFVRFSSGSLGFRALVFIGTLFFTFKSFLKHKLDEISDISWTKIMLSLVYFTKTYHFEATDRSCTHRAKS